MKCGLVLLLLISLVSAEYHEKCTAEEHEDIRQCIMMFSNSATIENKTVEETREVCMEGRNCFEGIECLEAYRSRQILKAGCDYEIFLLTKFKTCREIIKSNSNCLNMDYNSTAQHCDMFKSMYQCVLPVIKDKCGSEKLARKFRQKYLLHNKLSFQCGALE